MSTSVAQLRLDIAAHRPARLAHEGFLPTSRPVSAPADVTNPRT